MLGNIKAERKAIEKTYTDTCDIVREVEKEVDYINRHIEETVYSNIPCALVMSKNPITPTDTVAFFNYSAKIFLAPEIEVFPGDKIIVTRYGKTVEYTNAGRSAIYATHQEVMVLDNAPVLGGDDYENES